MRLLLHFSFRCISCRYLESLSAIRAVLPVVVVAGSVHQRHYIAAKTGNQNTVGYCSLPFTYFRIVFGLPNLSPWTWILFRFSYPRISRRLIYHSHITSAVVLGYHNLTISAFGLRANARAAVTSILFHRVNLSSIFLSQSLHVSPSLNPRPLSLLLRKRRLRVRSLACAFLHFIFLHIFAHPFGDWSSNSSLQYLQTLIFMIGFRFLPDLP